MHVKQKQTFFSRITGQEIKVTRIKRLFPGHSSEYDLCRVANVNNGVLDKTTARVIYADSIRRKYWAT